MKRMLVLANMIGAIIVLTAGASAGVGARLRADVPFAFYVEKDLLPAGHYTFEMMPLSPNTSSASSVLVRRSDGSAVVRISTIPGDNSVRSTVAQLVFNKYGEKYFLSQVENSDFQANLRLTKVERELRANIGKPGAVNLAAE